ncbi:hypothetical protein Rahaq_2545 [Rahnella aceris]|uniref:Uncharacterized protein n=1 Tax=Rahnella sp. (strain Y9602) TaxID=2703885 RepID=A0A0H3FGX8_RAHSY|nr:DUF2732 family protein [Rahnella aceris]ADW74152.1 hypothetical protein Rahaq_2545 [Rahnella aceris]MBU9839364.1 DUF2732 family protein [Rahnella aceris]
MNLSRNDRPKHTPVLRGFDQSSPAYQDAESLDNILKNARAESMADAAVKYSGRLERLAAYIATEGLNAAEAVELLRQESEQFGRAL